MRYLLLWLEAPLQAWGVDSKFGQRDTLPFPSKSGVLGLLCCALGRGGEQEEWLEKYGRLPMRVLSFISSDYSKPLFLKDYHVVGNGYDETDPFSNRRIPKKSDGKKPSGGEGMGSKITSRLYIQDGAFAVILEIPEEDGDILMDALRNPTWPLFLGRKCCAPTDLIGRDVFDTFDLAKEKAHQIALSKKKKLDFEVIEGSHDGRDMVLNDVPVCFGVHKKYQERVVTFVECMDEEIEVKTHENGEIAS